MIHYFDASALVKNYVHEDGSDGVQEMLRGAFSATSRLSQVEVTSALSRRTREGLLDPTVRNQLVRELEEDMTALYVVELVPEVVTQACRFLMQHALRSADAIQLASAYVLKKKVRAEVLFVGFDDRLIETAQLEGLDTRP